jgi:hypothetical protein
LFLIGSFRWRVGRSMARSRAHVLRVSDHVLLLYGSSSVPFDHFIKIVDSRMQELFFSYSSIKYRDAQLAIRPGSGRAAQGVFASPNLVKKLLLRKGLH